MSVCHIFCTAPGYVSRVIYVEEPSDYNVPIAKFVNVMSNVSRCRSHSENSVVVRLIQKPD